LDFVSSSCHNTGVTKDIGKYIKDYNMCQRIKNRAEIPVGKLMTNEILKKMWMYLTVDFIMKLLLVVEKNMILVVCDKLSKMLWQLLISKTNDYTSGKSLKLDIKWKVHKRTRQGVSAKLESYIY